MREDKGKHRKQEEEESDSIRLNKYVAKCGIASRRKAAELIKEGLVKVNDQVVLDIGYRLLPADVVSFKGKVIKPEEHFEYYLLNKPKDYITTAKDEKNRRTIFDLLDGKIDSRLFPVGRLDRATTGLLLLTNDGDLALKLTHPKYKVQKVYHVVLDKTVSESDLEKIKDGLILDDGKAVVDNIGYAGLRRDEVGIEIHIGKNRIIRRIFEHLGYKVKRLDRTYYAGLTKKNLPRGRYRALTPREVIMLKHFTGK